MSKMSMLHLQFLFTTINFTILICNNNITHAVTKWSKNEDFADKLNT